ncbi:MAG: hypothetical protein P1U61_08595 [Legionellaceae bacterium]|nr:hypothetical protein [Legionellaceae bacterium]
MKLSSFGKYFILGFFLFGMCPVFAGEMPENTITFDNCEGSGVYRKDFGLEILTQPGLKQYLSAVDIQHSNVCLTHDSPQKSCLNHLTLVWHSEREIPQIFALYGVEQSGGKQTDVFLRMYSKPQYVQVGDQFITEVDLTTFAAFNTYHIKVLQGGHHNRLMLRKVIPYFQCYPDAISDPLLQLASNISRSMTYGNGVHALSADDKKDPDSVARAIRAAPTAHCGNLAFLFMYDLSEYYQSTIYGIYSPISNAAHTVVEVEVDGQLKTYDPTLGVFYDCSILDLQDGTCDYSSEISSGPIDSKFKLYRSMRFFYHATIVSRYHNINEASNAYRTL